MTSIHVSLGYSRSKERHQKPVTAPPHHARLPAKDAYGCNNEEGREEATKQDEHKNGAREVISLSSLSEGAEQCAYKTTLILRANVRLYERSSNR